MSSVLPPRRRLRPAAVAADPDESLRIDEDAVLALGPVESRQPSPPQLAAACPTCRTRAPAAPRSRAAPRESTADVQHPDVIARIDRDRRHLAEHPVVRDRRPLRVELERRRLERAGLLSAGGRRGRHRDTEDHHGRSEDGEGSVGLREHVRLQVGEAYFDWKNSARMRRNASGCSSHGKCPHWFRYVSADDLMAA